MSSPSTQFATSTRMGIYEPYHQISMWEDSFKIDITPNTGLSTVVQLDSKLDNNVKIIEVFSFAFLNLGLFSFALRLYLVGGFRQEKPSSSVFLQAFNNIKK